MCITRNFTVNFHECDENCLLLTHTQRRRKRKITFSFYSSSPNVIRIDLTYTNFAHTTLQLQQQQCRWKKNVASFDSSIFQCMSHSSTTDISQANFYLFCFSFFIFIFILFMCIYNHLLFTSSFHPHFQLIVNTFSNKYRISMNN